jgi:hypothetical protein
MNYPVACGGVVHFALHFPFVSNLSSGYFFIVLPAILLLEKK